MDNVLRLETEKDCEWKLFIIQPPRRCLEKEFPQTNALSVEGSTVQYNTCQSLEGEKWEVNFEFGGWRSEGRDPCVHKLIPFAVEEQSVFTLARESCDLWVRNLYLLLSPLSISFGGISFPFSCNMALPRLTWQCLSTQTNPFGFRSPLLPFDR